jgi:predicted Rossmann fold flavoprotein
MGFLTALGLPLKVERGGRVFPKSDKSSDVIKTLEKEMRRCGVKIHLNTEVLDVWAEEGTVKGIRLTDGTKVKGDAVVVATGGLSYPSTGSTGDGYRFAKNAGHMVTELSPGLVPFCVKEEWVPELMGLSLKNIQAVLTQGKKELYRGFGEMLFTHFGVSGPLMISASSIVTKAIQNGELRLSVDLKPALSKEQLEARLIREFGMSPNRQLKHCLESMLPKKLAPVVMNEVGLSEERRVNGVSQQERDCIVDGMKNLCMTLTGLRGFDEAVITRGGVAVKEVSPSTMESRLVRNLYFIGEVLDVDAFTGGFNLQIAWSTAYAAANSLVSRSMA